MVIIIKPLFEVVVVVDGEVDAGTETDDEVDEDHEPDELVEAP